MTPVWFAAAAAAGALVRHACRHWSWRGTLAVNLVGSALLGVLVAADPPSGVLTVFGTAGCGSLTTFGTFVLEATGSSRRERTVIVAATVVGSVLAAATGWWVVSPG